tara:strand:+ start:92467 stop:93408 length:942 start_codon:yes stop_codon:yes gene_type:complete
MPICVFDIFPDGTTKVPDDTALTGPGAYRWWHYDLSDPSLASWVATHLPPIPAGALMQPETRPRCDEFGDGLMLNLRGINMNAGQHADQMVSVRMWVAADVVITVRLRKIYAIDEIRQLAVAHAAPPSPAVFLRALIGRLTARVQEEVAQLAARTEFYETDLEDRSTPPPKDLPITRRSVIKLRRYLDPQRAALVTLAEIDLPIIPEADALHLRELANRTTIVVEELDALQQRIVTVQDEHDNQTAQRQARHGHVLSLAAALFLPLGFVTGLFGVNVGGMPGVDDARAFALLCLSLLVLAAVMLGVLKWLRWL